MEGFLPDRASRAEGVFRILTIELTGELGETTGYTYRTASGAAYPFSNATQLPEPASLAMCSAGLVLLACGAGRRSSGNPAPFVPLKTA